MRDLIDLCESLEPSFPGYGEHQDLIEQHCRDVIAVLEQRGYTRVDGRLRVAMVAPDRRTVVKVPICDEGMTANSMEARAWSRQLAGDAFIPIAACRVFFADRDVGVPMLMMRYVEAIDNPKGLPDWVNFVDGAQVGYDHRRRLVAYDL